MPHDRHAPAAAGAARPERAPRLRVLRALPLLAALIGPAARVTIYCDGACLGNPGPGGWAAIIIEGDTEREISGAAPATTNQRMELTGALQGLRAIAPGQAADVYSDSAYVINCFRDRWYLRWRENGWKNSQKKPVENRDLWEALLAEVESREVRWHKVAGHAGVPLNERADRLAAEAIRRMLAAATTPAR